MSGTPPVADTVLVDAAELNARIRLLSAGRTSWSADELTELARLRGQWQAAVDDEAARAV